MTEGETSPRSSPAEEPQIPSAEPPTMGGIQTMSDGSLAVWTGGEPNRTWTSLIDPAPGSINPTQYRPTSIGASTKSQHYRTAGLSTKFSRDSDLLTFQKKVLNHLEEHGLDTITYLPSPTDDRRMITVITNHARFTLKQAMENEETRDFMYDTYDKSNIRDAKKFLMNSIDESLENQMYENCPDDSTFITYWMNLMRLVGSVSVNRFDKIKNRLKGRSVNQYPGQDISLLCSDWKELHGASMYDYNLTMNMVNIIMEAGTEDFRYELRGLKKNLDNKLLETRYKPYEETHQELVKEELDVESVLKKCKEEYRNLLDDGKWPAAAHVKDNRNLNRGYGTANMAERNKLTKLLAHALEQIQGPSVRDKSNDKCKECGQLGHWARDCPRPRDKGRAPFNSPLRKGQRVPVKNRQPNRGMKRTKFPPPRSGESETRTGPNGKTYYWCARCRNWTISHGTSQHKSKEELQGQTSTAHNVLARINMSDQPSAFKVNYKPGKQKSTTKDNQLVIDVILGVTAVITKDLITKATLFGLIAWMHIKHIRLHSITTNPWIHQQVKSYLGPMVQVSVRRCDEIKRLNVSQDIMFRRLVAVERIIRKPKDNTNTRTKKNSSSHKKKGCKVNASCHMTSKKNKHNGITRKNQVLFDSGANCWITYDKNDFMGTIDPVPNGSVVEGLEKSGLAVTGQGTIAWTFKSSNGTKRTLTAHGLLVPLSPIRIAGTKSIFDAYPNETIVMTSAGLVLGGDKNHPELSIPLCKTSGLPYATLDTPNVEPKGISYYFEPLISLVHKVDSTLFRKTNLPMPSLTEGANFNLSDPEKELLRWHYRLGHVALTKVQWMFRQGYLGNTERERQLQGAASKLASCPMCTACQYAKQRRKPAQGSTKRNVPESEGALKRDQVFPGQEGSADHFTCNPKGRLPTGYGKESMDKKYSGGCILVDSASSYTYVAPQVSPSSHETLSVIKGFEQFASSFGVVIQRYISDNGSAFTSSEFATHLEQFHQVSTFASAGAHHHNGIAERNIGTVLSITCAMLHHQALHWPDVSDVELWPFAVLYATYILNRIPQSRSGQSPLELFSRTVWPRTKFHNLHVWGCPCYVLDSALAGGHKLPCFTPRSQRHMFLGISQDHTGDIPLVLNLDTGSTRTHYHVVVDDWFNTVHTSDSTQVNFDHDDWYKTFGLTDLQYIGDDLSPHPDPPPQDFPNHRLRDSVEQAREANLPPIPLSVPPPPLEPRIPPSPPPVHAVPAPSPPVESPPVPSLPPPPQREKSPARPFVPQELPLQREPTDQREQSKGPPNQREPPSASPHKLAPRTPKPDFKPIIQTRAQKLREQRTLRPRDVLTAICQGSRLIPEDVETKPIMGDYMDPLLAFWTNVFENTPCLLTSSSNSDLPDYTFAFKAKAKGNRDPDLFNWDEAMNSPYREDFLKAAVEEIRSLEEQNTWTEVPRHEARDRIIPCQWVFRLKRTPDGEVKKVKGRLVLRGDLQQYTGETFSPVASWTTVRVFLVVSETQGRVTCTIDFSNAFVQSPLPADKPVWMHLPRGFRSILGAEACVFLNKSLYGHAVAPLLWYKHICKYFEKLGLKKSKYDPCLWYGRGLMIVQYVDDMGISAERQEDIDLFVSDLRKEGLVLTQEESFSEFLGIKFETCPDGSKEMTQKGLIKKILNTAGMEDCNPNALPHGSQPLVKDLKGEPMKEPWIIRAIVGMLLYLSTNTRPDIAFAVSQVCRFTSNPRQSHATGVKTILRYLKGTQEKGTIVKPSPNIKLDLYVDADFAGTHGVEENNDPDSAKSRMGYILFLSGWPLVWKSQLLSCISTSTTHAEYHALSSALKVLLPCKWVTQEIVTNMPSMKLENTTIHATAFEDNAAAFHLATNQRLTNRTKYFWIKLHWFWEHYNNKEFDISKCPSDANIADFYTKCLSRDKFTTHRKSAIGW